MTRSAWGGKSRRPDRARMRRTVALTSASPASSDPEWPVTKSWLALLCSPPLAVLPQSTGCATQHARPLRASVLSAP